MRGIKALLLFLLLSLPALALTPLEQTTNIAASVKASAVYPNDPRVLTNGQNNVRLAGIGMTNNQISGPTNILADRLWFGGITSSPKVVIGTNISDGVGDNAVLNVVGTSPNSDWLFQLQNTDPTKKSGHTMLTWNGVTMGWLHYKNTNDTAGAYSNIVELAADEVPLHIRADSHGNPLSPIRFIMDTNIAAEVRTNGDFWIAGNFIGGGSGLNNVNLSDSAYAVTNWPAAADELVWNFANLTNHNGTETMALLRRVGFHPAAATAGLLGTVSNLVCITNIPGVQGAGLFMHQWTQGSNGPALYLTYSNRWGANFANMYIASVRVLGTWVTNEATVSSLSFMRFPNLSAKTNLMMAVGDVFNLDNHNFHFNIFRSGLQLSIYTNGLTGNYTGEDSVGRVWIPTRDPELEGGGMQARVNTFNFTAGGGARWECGWELLSGNAIRVFAGPHEAVRTIDGLTMWKPIRSFWYEDISNDGSTNRGISFLCHQIRVAFHRTGTWPIGVYLETNNAAPYRSVSFRGNIITANSVTGTAMSVGTAATDAVHVPQWGQVQTFVAGFPYRPNYVFKTNWIVGQWYTNFTQSNDGFTNLPGQVFAEVGARSGASLERAKMLFIVADLSGSANSTNFYTEVLSQGSSGVNVSNATSFVSPFIAVSNRFLFQDDSDSGAGASIISFPNHLQFPVNGIRY